MSTLKKVIAGSLVLAFALVGGIKSASAAYMQTSTLKMGMTSSQVMSLQQTLNMTSCKVATSGTGSAGMESSYFGAKTKAAVECFQAANGLTADGVVGAMTGAKLAAVTAVSTPVNTGLPLGCASSTGYSTTTGAPCSGGAGSTVVYPAGCTSSVGFSSTTGASCSTGVVSTTPSSTGPFSINSVQPVSGYLATEVAVGAQNKVIGDMRIVAGAGGSASLTGVNVNFYNRGTGDYQFIKYASSVSLWLNGVQVGSLPATSFTQYNSQYSAFIPTSGAVLNPNTTNDLQIAISALPVIDSANLGSTSNTWAFEAQTLRYTDSTGSFSYTIPSSENFDNGTITSGSLQSSAVFSSASSANSITLTVTKDTNDATNRVTAGQSGTTTQNVTLAMIDLTAQGSPVTVNRLPVHIAVTNSGSGSTNAGSLINTLRLYNSAGTQLDSEVVPVSANPQIIFQNLNLTIPVGSSQVFTIKGDLNAVDGSVVAPGATAQVSVLSGDVAAIQAYDQNNNVLNNNSSNILLGSTTGSVITFYVNGITVVAAGTPTNTYSNPGGSQSHGTFSMVIPFSVTSYGQTAYIPSTAVLATAASSTTHIQFGVDNGTALGSGATGVISYGGSDLTVDTNGNWMIPVGQTKTFTLSILYNPSSSGLYRASLLNVPWNLTDSNTAYSMFTSGFNSASFQTPYVSGQ
jgi:peptidoglycan hydrolase-like protein with peptidoglycan-binding domain